MTHRSITTLILCLIPLLAPLFGQITARVSANLSPRRQMTPSYPNAQKLGAPAQPWGMIDVRSYGAVGDGRTDDTAAIQAAIDACTTHSNVALRTAGSSSESVGGGIVFFPATSEGYRITSTINVSKTKIVLQGPARIIVAADITAFDLDYAGSSDKTWAKFMDLDITGGAVGIDIGTNPVAMPCLIYNCKFINQTTVGVKIGSDGFNNAIRDCLFTGCGVRHMASGFVVRWFVGEPLCIHLQRRL